MSRILYLASILFLFACSEKEEVLSVELQNIEDIMWVYPDSALVLLDNMPIPPKSDKKTMQPGVFY